MKFLHSSRILPVGPVVARKLLRYSWKRRAKPVLALGSDAQIFVGRCGDVILFDQKPYYPTGGVTQEYMKTGRYYEGALVCPFYKEEST